MTKRANENNESCLNFFNVAVKVILFFFKAITLLIQATCFLVFHAIHL